MERRKNEATCILGMLRKGNRMGSSPELLGLFNLHVMHKIVNKAKFRNTTVLHVIKTGYFFLICRNVMTFFDSDARVVIQLSYIDVMGQI